jgi:hypothetical protein
MYYINFYATIGVSQKYGVKIGSDHLELYDPSDIPIGTLLECGPDWYKESLSDTCYAGINIHKVEEIKGITGCRLYRIDDILIPGKNLLFPEAYSGQGIDLGDGSNIMLSNKITNDTCSTYLSPKDVTFYKLHMTAAYNPLKDILGNIIPGVTYFSAFYVYHLGEKDSLKKVLISGPRITSKGAIAHPIGYPNDSSCPAMQDPHSRTHRSSIRMGNGDNTIYPDYQTLVRLYKGYPINILESKGKYIRLIRISHMGRREIPGYVEDVSTSSSNNQLRISCDNSNAVAYSDSFSVYLGCEMVEKIIDNKVFLGETFREYGIESTASVYRTELNRISPIGKKIVILFEHPREGEITILPIGGWNDSRYLSICLDVR